MISGAKCSFLFAAIALGCGGGGGKKRPLGATCELASECASGLCAENRCVDPEGDEDKDGLSNSLEAELGTNLFDADTDGDGSDDADELDANFARKDSDGDGHLDAVESLLEDADLDCIVDQLDVRNIVPDGADDSRVPELCPAPIGVCGAAGAVLRVMCPDGVETPVCDFAEVPGYEATETTCDAADNDCDATVDEGCDPLRVGLIGHWKLDGDGQDSGPHGSHGTVVGATGAKDRFGVADNAMRFEAGAHITATSTEHPRGDVTASYSVWVRPDRDAGGDLGVFTFGEALAKNRRSALVLTGDRHCAEYTAEENDAPSDIVCPPGGHWTHVVVTRVGRDVTFYYDGRHHGTVQIAPGQDLARTVLTIGLSDVDTVYEPFAGAIDDLRAWDRVISPDEIQLLFTEGGWQWAGTDENPAQSCLHVRDAATLLADSDHPPTDTYSLDTDGDGPRAPFSAWCDMDLDGGGWTLAWVYGFTDFAAFGEASNAVTPIPSWPTLDATVPVSTTVPSSPTTPGAIDWAVWKDLGRAFAVVSDLADGIACEPGAGSLADGLDGWLDCETVVDTTQTCQGVVPTGIYFSRIGPTLYAQDLYYYFDGSADENWPAHDPCGMNTPQHVESPAREGGAVYLRETNRPLQWPAQCDYVSGLQRVDGPRRIDPDGVGGAPSFDVDCDFTVERGGWTRVSDAMLASIADRPEVRREFLFKKGARFYRSPSLATTWTDTFTPALGRWVYAGSTAGSFECTGVGATGTVQTGIGCGEGGRVYTEDPVVDGAVDLCQPDPDAFGTGQTCTEVELWVRENACAADDGSLLGDGDLDVVAASEGSWQSPCWYAWGPGGWLDAFTADVEEVPPGGSSPSLRIDNPTAGNDIFAVELGQQGLALIAGESYTLSFWARAAAPRGLRAFVQSADLVRVHHQDVPLTTEWARFVIDFAAAATMWNAMVNLQLADETATVWIDDLTLEVVAP